MSDAGARRLLERLFDDAALFPPGNAPMEMAVRAHVAHLAAWYGDFVGPFICPDRRIPQLREALTSHGFDDRRMAVSLLVTGDDPAEALDAIAGDDRLELAAVEARLPATGEAPDAARQLVRAVADQLDDDVPVYVELPPDEGMDAGLDVLADRGRRAKLRTGGETAAAFPSEAQVAEFILGCVERKITFKCTAGLHSAVRHTDASTGFEHHGFLNVALAVHVALQRPSHAAVRAVLAERQGDDLVEQAAALGGDSVNALRRWFASYGTCSVTEPIDDVVDLGLIRPS